MRNKNKGPKKKWRDSTCIRHLELWTVSTTPAFSVLFEKGIKNKISVVYTNGNNIRQRAVVTVQVETGIIKQWHQRHYRYPPTHNTYVLSVRYEHQLQNTDWHWSVFQTKNTDTWNEMTKQKYKSVYFLRNTLNTSQTCLPWPLSVNTRKQGIKYGTGKVEKISAGKKHAHYWWAFPVPQYVPNWSNRKHL